MLKNDQIDVSDELELNSDDSDDSDDEENEDTDQRAKTLTSILQKLFFEDSEIMSYKDKEGLPPPDFKVSDFGGCLIITTRERKYFDRLLELLADNSSHRVVEEKTRCRCSDNHDRILIENKGINEFIQYLENHIVAKAIDKPTIMNFSFFIDNNFSRMFLRKDSSSLGYTSHDVEKLCHLPPGNITNIKRGVMNETLKIICNNEDAAKIVKEKLELIFAQQCSQEDKVELNIKIHKFDPKYDIPEMFEEPKDEVYISLNLPAYKILSTLINAESPHRPRKYLGFGN